MRHSRPVAPIGSSPHAAPDAAPDAADFSSDSTNAVRGRLGGAVSAMQSLARAAHVDRSRIAPVQGPRPADGGSPVGRIDLAHITAGSPLHRPTVTGGGTHLGGDHVGGGLLPPASHTVSLSDGTRISFRAVEEIPLLEGV